MKSDKPGLGNTITCIHTCTYHQLCLWSAGLMNAGMGMGMNPGGMNQGGGGMNQGGGMNSGGGMNQGMNHMNQGMNQSR